MRISVIIPVYNNSATLERCLAALEGSSYVPHEVIVVDDGSTDDSAAIGRRYASKLVGFAENRGVGAARNAGARAATGDVLFYTDGDVEIRHDTLAIGAAQLERSPGITAIVGVYAKAGGPANFCSDFKNLCYHHLHMESPSYTHLFVGNCGLIRRSAWFELGGFSETLPFGRILEDVELGLRLTASGHRIALNKQMQVVHWREYSIPSLVRSDLVKRAIPWTRLLLRNRSVHLENCTGIKAFVCLALAQLVVWSSLAQLVLPPWLWPLSVTAFLTSMVLDAPLLAFLYRERGVWFALRSIPMRLLYYFVGGLGAAVGLAQGLPQLERRASVEAQL